MSNINEAVSFLKAWSPKGPWALVAIPPSGGKPVGKVFYLRTENAMKTWLKEHVATYNLYFTVNDVDAAFTRGKADKTEIACIRGLHVDVDPIDGNELKDEQVRIKALLKSFPISPTAIVFTGGGLQAFWKLKAPVDVNTALDDDDDTRYAPAETPNKTIERLAGGKGTANIDRVMRLPGTRNLPNASKRKKGRKAADTKLVYFKSERTYSLDDFADLPALPPIVETWLGPLLLTGERPDRDEPYNSRSEASFAAVAELKKSGVDKDDARAVMLDPAYAISEHLLDQKDPDRAFERAWDDKRLEGSEPTADADLETVIQDMNERFIQSFDGGQHQIMQFTPTAGLEGPYRFLAPSAFLAMHEGKDMIKLGKKSLSVAEYWMAHPLRRQIEAIVFQPGEVTPDHYNLWQGWSVEPLKKSNMAAWSLFQEHIWQNVCGEDFELYHYYMSWWAHKLQRPNKKVGTALILRGGEGTGKTSTAKVFQRIFGPHMLKVNDSQQVMGRFNGSHAALLVLHSEESFWAGNKSLEGKLKDIITSDTQQIEFKGKEPKVMPNYYDLYVTGNPDWMVPASLDARRFAVYEIGKKRTRDAKFFDAMRKQMWDGEALGCRALMRYLLDYPALDNMDDIPITAALVSQKELTMSTMHKVLLGIAEDGEIPGSSPADPSRVLTSSLYEAYIATCDQLKDMHGRKDIRSFGRELAKLGVVRKQPGAKARVYQFPPLDEYRANFDKLFSKKRNWSDTTDWTYTTNYEGEE
jgi:hypothetical protein